MCLSLVTCSQWQLITIAKPPSLSFAFPWACRHSKACKTFNLEVIDDSEESWNCDGNTIVIVSMVLEQLGPMSHPSKSCEITFWC